MKENVLVFLLLISSATLSQQCSTEGNFRSCNEPKHLTFVGIYHNFYLSLILDGKGETLDIEVTNTLKGEIHYQKIDQIFIDKREAFKVFEDPIQIFDYLQQNFHRVIIEEGKIWFHYVWGKSISREKLMLIQLIKQQGKHEQLSYQLCCDEQKDKTIRAQQEKIEMLQLAILQFQNKVQEMLYEKQKKIQQLFGNITAIFMKLKEQKKEKSQLHLDILQLREDSKYLYEEIKKKVTISPIDQDPLSYEYGRKSFHISTRSGLSSTLIKLIGTQNRYYNFINKEEIFPYERVIYRISINQSYHDDITLGFCTGKCIQIGLDQQNQTDQFYFLNQQSVYFNISGCGTFWQGAGSDGPRMSNCDRDGAIIDLQADLQGKVFKWWINGELAKEIHLPNTMKGKSVQLSAIMHERYDQIEIQKATQLI